MVVSAFLCKWQIFKLMRSLVWAGLIFQQVTYEARRDAMSWCMIWPMRPLHSLSTYRKARWHKTSLPINATSRSLHDLIIRVFVIRVPAEKCMLIHCPKWHSWINIRPMSNGNNGPLHPFPNPNTALASSTGACQEKRETLSKEPNEMWWAWKHQARPPPLKNILANCECRGLLQTLENR